MARCHCGSAETVFDPRVARRELKRFRKRGPSATARALIAGIESAELPRGSTVLDVGGGVGAIHHGLLAAGFSQAMQVDASQAYLAAAREESERLGHGGRVTFRHGDFAGLSIGLPEFDVVALDRVVCCDPDPEALLSGAASRARRLVAFSYPRRRLLVRMAVAAANGFRRIAGEPFRAYLHEPSAMAAVLERKGLKRRSAGGTFIWAAEIYER